MRLVAIAMLASLLLPAAAAAQESDVTRRSYTFISDRLLINVLGRTQGELQVVRGEPGRVEVAARSSDGFPGFGLGGTLTRELRLTSVGADLVRFLVVVPEHVLITVQLPGGGTRTLPSSAGSASFSWGDAAEASVPGDDLPLMPTLAGGLYLIHSTTWAPPIVDIPDLQSVRSVALRFEGSEFRIAASRPLGVQSGSRNRFALEVTGEPVDIVLYVPRGNALFQLRSGDRRIAELVSGRPRALCSNVIIQRPTPAQDWLTFHPREGRLDCR